MRTAEVPRRTSCLSNQFRHLDSTQHTIRKCQRMLSVISEYLALTLIMMLRRAIQAALPKQKMLQDFEKVPNTTPSSLALFQSQKPVLWPSR